MAATVPIWPSYPDLQTLDSLFNEGAVSFAKLAAEAERKKDEKMYQFDFGVSPKDVIHFMYSSGNHSGNQQEGREKRGEKGARKMLLKKEKEKHRKSKLKIEKVAEVKKSSMDDIDESLDLLVPVKRSKSSETGVNTTAENGSIKSAASSALPSKQQSPLESSQPTNETPVAMESIKPEKGAARVSTETSTQQPTVSLETKLSEPPPRTVASQEEATHQLSRENSSSSETKGKTRKTARDKFRQCENCDQVIRERIQLCSGCKKVAYCNVQCQKTHWKLHKKTCSYALKKESKAGGD